MLVRDLQAYLVKHCQPDYEVVIMDPSGTFGLAYADRSGSERLALLVTKSKRWTPADREEVKP